MFALAKLIHSIPSTLSDVIPQGPHRVLICNTELLPLFHFFHIIFMKMFVLHESIIQQWPRTEFKVVYITVL